MSYTNGSIAETSEGSITGSSEAYGPFESEYAETEAPGSGESEVPAYEDSFVAESPFVAGEAFDGTGAAGFAGDLHELLAELYDSEFDRQLMELSDAAAEAAGESPFVQGEVGSAGAEGFVREWLEPLHREAETMFEAIGETFADKDLARLSEDEVDELLAPHEPIGTGENPVFENFLGGLWKKAKSIVSGAVDLAKKGISAIGKLLPINIILGRLKVLVRPLLERVLQMALDRLPPGLRPAAEQLKRRLLGETAGEEPATELDGQVAATADVSEIQREFDANAASLLLAADETEQDKVVAEAFEATEQPEDPINDLNRAREDFAAELQALSADGDPRPAVEHFIPVVMAAMPLLRMGISLIGRDRIVRTLADFISPMIRPYTGDLAPQLSQAIASTGLSVMSLEAPVDAREVAANAVVGTIEDTVREVAEESSEALEHPELLEATVASAFDRAAGRHFPPALLKPRLRQVYLGTPPAGAGRPQSQHPNRHHGMWVRLPRARWYRRYTTVLTARITPTIARQVRVFGGATLEAFLRDHYGLTGEVTAPAHLYEALPGATLGRIAAHEKRTRGLGRSGAYWKLLPLTPEAAGLLLGEPGLGRRVDPEFLAKRHRIAVGQRFYYLEFPGGGREGPVAPGAATTRPRSSQVNVRVNMHKHRVRVLLHLTEADAQEAAARLRGKEPMAVAKMLRERLQEGLSLALSPNPAGHLRWIEAPAGVATVIAKAIHPPLLADPAVARGIAARVLGWAGGPLIEFANRRPQDVVAAVEQPARGVTFVIHLHGVPAQLGQEGAPTATVEIVPGFRNA